MRRPRVPSPSMAVALVALFVSLGGAGYAAVKINGKQITPRTITAGKVKRNALTGAEINEARLGKVRSAARADRATRAGVADSAATAGAAGTAARADSAARAETAGRADTAARADAAASAERAGDADTVGGARVRSFRWAVAVDQADFETVLDLDGLVVQARCTAGSGTLTRVFSSQGAAALSGAQNSDLEGDANLSEHRAFDLALSGTPAGLPIEARRATGTLIYRRSDRTVTVTFWVNEGGGGTTPCEMQGTATSAPVT